MHSRLLVISSTIFDSCYIPSKGVDGLHAKFVGSPIVGVKKNAIWLPKSSVTITLDDPIKFGDLKRIHLLL